MAHMVFDDETLMAFADGELDEVSSRHVEKAVEEDEGIAARVALFRATRARVSAAMAPLAGEPVPAGLHLAVAAMIERDREARDNAARAAANIVQIGERRERQSQPRRAAPGRVCVF